MDENPRHGNQTGRIDSRNEVEKGNMNLFDVRGDTKWRNKDAKEIQVPNAIEWRQDFEEMISNCCVEDEFVADVREWRNSKLAIKYKGYHRSQCNIDVEKYDNEVEDGNQN